MLSNHCSNTRKFTICRCSFSVAMHLFGLNWHLQPMQRQIYQLTEDNTSGLHLPTDLGLPPLGNTGLEFPDRGSKDDGMSKPDVLKSAQMFNWVQFLVPGGIVYVIHTQIWLHSSMECPVYMIQSVPNE